jgi:hypothetical protein
MGPRRRPSTTRLGRLLRGRRIDRNPLRRGSDRAETAVVGLLLAAFLAGAPLAAHAAGSWAYIASAREQHVQQALLYQAPAAALAFVPPGTAPGTTVMAGVNPVGQQEGRPLQHAQVAGRARLAAGLAVAAVAVTLFIVGELARRVLDKRRLAAWEADWLVTGPRWSPRR